MLRGVRPGALTRRAAALGLALSALSCGATDARGGGGAGGADASAGRGAGSGAGSGADPSAGRGAGVGQSGGAGVDVGPTAGRGGSGAGSGSRAGTGGGDACTRDGETFADGQTGIPSPDGCNTCGCENGQLTCTERGCAPDLCLVARRLDRCCPVYEAVRQSALADDPCLVADPGPPLDATLAQDCYARSPDSCAGVACNEAAPPSRLSEPDGTGGCRFTDECQSAADCVIAIDSRQCCTCGASMPKALLEHDVCFAVEGSTPPPGADCPGCSLPVLCGMCVPPPELPSCVLGDALNRCE